MHIYVLKRLDVLVYHRLKLEYCAKGRGCVGASRYDAAPRPAATAIAVATTAQGYNFHFGPPVGIFYF